MYDRHFIRVVNHADPTIPDVRIDFTSFDEASQYWDDNHETAESEGCRLLLCSERTMPVDIPLMGSDVCMVCAGTGTIVTRYGGPEGMFPDEDWCPRCGGSGRISLPSDNSAARAA